MSDNEYEVPNVHGGASYTYTVSAAMILRNGYIVIMGRPCQVVEVSTSETGERGHGNYHFVGIDIFTGKELEDTVSASHDCDVPHVTHSDYHLIGICEDGFVSLMTEDGSTKDDVKHPTDGLLTQLKDDFAEGKNLVVSVLSAMGEEQIISFKEIVAKY